jgi:protein-S-isoprenylcysteine O-methyltransferase Ste14
MNRENIALQLHVLSGLIVLVLSFLTKLEASRTKEILKPLGLWIFAFGIILLLFAVLYLKRVFLGHVKPINDKLITTGPYRLIRHPAYLGMIISILGINIALGSVVGLSGSIILYIPSTIYRARLEEKALQVKFGSVWPEYANRTYFIIPLIY